MWPISWTTIPGKDYNNFGSYEKQDIWKAQLIFTYKF